MSGAEPPARPQYGEYASPEQQAAAAGMPYRPHLQAPPPHGQVPVTRVAPPQTASGGPGVSAAPIRSRRWDTVVTFVLLGYGLFNVLIGSSQYTDLAGLINSQLYGPQKIGTFDSSPLSIQLGVVIVVSQAILFAVTAVLALISVRAGRISFWIPIVGAVVAATVVFICFAALVFPDPAYQAWAQHLMG